MNCWKIYSLCLLSCTGIVGCRDVAKDSDKMKFEHVYELKHKAYDTELMLTIGYMQSLDSLLLITSLETDKICTFYSLQNNMKEVFQYGTLGNGPGEYLQPLLTYSYGNSFGINEVNKQELIVLGLDMVNGKISVSEQKRMKVPYKIEKEKLNLPDYYFIRLDDSHFVSQVCAGENNFFTLLDDSLRPVERFGESPVREELPPYASRTRLHGHLAAHEGTLFFASNNLPYLSCYQLKFDKMYKKWSFYYNEAHYGIRNGDLLFDREKSFGKVLDLDTDGRYVYLLYLDQLLSEYDFKKPDKSLANKILVFDYEGNRIAVLSLDCRIQTMTISSENGKIYGIAQQPEPIIVEFGLPEDLNV